MAFSLTENLPFIALPATLIVLKASCKGVIRVIRPVGITASLPCSTTELGSSQSFLHLTLPVDPSRIIRMPVSHTLCDDLACVVTWGRVVIDHCGLCQLVAETP